MDQEQYVSTLLAEEKKNEYSKVGQAYKKVINMIVRDSNHPDKSYLFETLNCMQLEEGYSLGLRLAEHHGMGDKSWFYTYSKLRGPRDYLNKLSWVRAQFESPIQMDHLLVQKNEMGAWQAYLYSIAVTMLPVFWHGGYYVRKYVFTHSELKDIGIIFMNCIEDPVLYGIKDKISPEVFLQGDKAVIKVCYWNDWVGLVRDTVEIVFMGNQIMSFEPINTEVIYEFNCGICY